MKNIKIITDSASDISLKLAEENGIHIIPLNVSFGEETFKDAYDITTREFYDKLKNCTELPKTAQVSINDFVEVYNQYADYDIIYVGLSARASGTYQNSFIAKGMVQEENPDIDITVIDSNNFTYGYGMWVLMAAKMVSDGASHDEVVDYLNEKLAYSEIMLTVSSLDFLQRGGRISSAAKVVANVLDIHPILCTEDGMIMSFAKARGSKKLVDKMTDIVSERIGDCHIISLLHTDYPEAIEKMKTSLLSKIPDAEFLEAEAGSCIGTHAGPGAFGMIYDKKKDI